MSIRKKGDVNLRLVGKRYRFDPVLGRQFVFIYEGFENALTSFAAQPQFTHAITDIQQHEGPIYRMEAAFGNATGPANEGTEHDTWERTVDFVQEDIRSNPLVHSLYGALPLSTTQLSQLAKDYNKAKTEQSKEEVPTTLTGNALILYELLARGHEAHEITRIVLTRRRTIPINYTRPRTPSAVEYIYTTAQLVTQFAIPFGIQVILPGTPAGAPNNSKWSWKVRVDSSTLIPDLQQTQEILSWTFAPWSTILYQEL